MKKITILYILLTVFFISCEKFIEETPKGSLIPKTIDDMGMILANETEINVGFGNTLGYSNDVKGLDALALGYTQADINALNFADYLYGANENDIDWNRLYHSISLCNFVTDNIDEAPEGIDGLYTREEIKGSALFHRAYTYFLLVNEYAKHYDPATAATDKGIPLLLHLDVNLVAQRATIQEIYDQIIKDAATATGLLPGDAELSYTPTKPAAHALLANAYLYMGKYTESWQQAVMVTQDKTLKDYNTVSRKVLLDPRNGFNNLDPLEWKREENLYQREHWGMFRNLLFVTDTLVNSYDPANDLRYQLFITNRLFGTNSIWGNDRNSGISLGDVYITEAEARVRDNSVPVADVLDVLNRFIRSRYKTGYTDITETDRAVLKQRIIEERRKEMAYRGFRLFDIKRLLVQDNHQEAISNSFGGQTSTLPAGSNKLVMPIPINVIEKTNMEQNPR